VSPGGELCETFTAGPVHVPSEDLLAWDARAHEYFAHTLWPALALPERGEPKLVNAKVQGSRRSSWFSSSVRAVGALVNLAQDVQKPQNSDGGGIGPVPPAAGSFRRRVEQQGAGHSDMQESVGRLQTRIRELSHTVLNLVAAAYGRCFSP
jgi:hypothetical protein